MYDYIGENVCMTINKNDFGNLFSIQVKAKKTSSEHVKTCKLSSGIRL